MPLQTSGAKLHRAAMQPAHAPKLLNNSHSSTAGRGLWQADLQLEPPFNERKISTCCYVSCVSPPPSPPTTTTTSNATFPSAIKKVHQLRCFLGFGRGGELEEMEGGWLWFLPLWQGLEEEMGVVLCKRPHWAYLFLRLLFPSPRPNAWQFWLDESAAKHFFFFLHAISTISAEA